MQANVLVKQQKREEKAVFYAIMLSVVLHAAFFMLFVALPEFTGKRQMNMQPIHVRIVGGGPAPQAVSPPREIAPATVKPEVAPVESVYIPPPQPQTVLPSNYGTTKPEEETDKPKPEETPEVKTLATRTKKPSDATRQVEKIEHELRQAQKAAQDAEKAVAQTSQTNTDSVASAIEQLRQKQAGAGTGTGSGPGSGPGSGTGGPLDIYLSIIIPIIEKNWSFSPIMFNGTSRMEVIISVRILPNGEITDMQFSKKSGNDYLDESGFKALAKSNPLPSFAGTGVRQTSLPLQFRFTPQGLQY